MAVSVYALHLVFFCVRVCTMIDIIEIKHRILVFVDVYDIALQGVTFKRGYIYFLYLISDF